MIYIYKNGKRITIGTNIAFVYLSAENEVIAKSPDKQEVEGASTVIGQIEDECYNNLIPISRKSQKTYYHKLKADAVDGKKLEDYDKVWDLDVLKSQKNAEIDKKTEDIIYNGYVFDNHIFDLSPESQRDWLGMFDLRNHVTYPFAVTTKDEKQYEFPNASVYEMFFMSGTTHINTTVSSGRAIKLQVMACNTKDEIDAIIDTRQ